MSRFSVISNGAIADPNISPIMLKVLAGLGLFLNEEQICWPSYGELAATINLSERTVIRAVKGLVNLGYIKVLSRFRKTGAQSSNEYKVLCVRGGDRKCHYDARGGDRERKSASEITNPVTPPMTSQSPHILTNPLEHTYVEDKSSTSEEGVETPQDANAKMVEIWNEALGEKLHQVVKVTDQRKAKMKLRLKDCFDGDLNKWRDFCERIARSSFLTGENDRRWKASLDWALNENNITKVLEGKYETRFQNHYREANSNNSQRNFGGYRSKSEQLDAIVQEIFDEIDAEFAAREADEGIESEEDDENFREFMVPKAGNFHAQADLRFSKSVW